MAWTFGAATGDDIDCTNMPNGLGMDNSHQLVTGWFYPTTLTAGNNYIGSSTVWGVYVDTTTSELRFKTDNTTDGEWTTSGAGITVDKWWFIAAICACENTGELGAWRCWIGDAETAPVEVTVSVAVALAGNFSGSSSALSIGNAGTSGTTAFQGDIESVTCLQTLNSTVNSVFTCATNGAISDNEAANVLQRLVNRIWMGRLDLPNNHASTAFCVHVPMIEPVAPIRYQFSGSTLAPIFACTASGATLSKARGPRPLVGAPIIYPAFKRR